MNRIIHAVLVQKLDDIYWDCWFEDGTTERRTINV